METLPEFDAKLSSPSPKRRRWGIFGVIVLLLAVAGAGLAVRQLETRHWEAGQKAIVEGEWETAVSEFSAILQLWPPLIRQHSVEAMALRGVAYYHQENLDDAMLDFAAALLADPNQVDIVAYQADGYFQQDNFDEAKSGAEQALAQPERLPAHLQAQLNANLALLPAGMLAEDERKTAVTSALDLMNFLPEETITELYTLNAQFALADAEEEEALAAIDRALALEAELTPDQQARLLPEKAALLAALGRWPDALTVSEAALALTDTVAKDALAGLHQLRSRIYFEQGELETTVTEAEAALAFDDTLAWPHALLGWHAYRTFAYDTALAEAEAALALDDTIALAYTVRGGIFTWEGKVHEALAELEQALLHNPEDIEAMALRVYNLREMSAVAEAEMQAEAAIALQPEAPAALWAKALIAAEGRDWPLTLTLMNQAIALDNGRPEFYHLRSFAYPFSSDRDKIAADLEASLALNPDFAPAILSQVVFRGERYDYTNIEEISQQLLAQWPEWYGSQLLAGYYYKYVVGDLDQALAAYDLVIELLPERASSYLPRAYLYLDLGEYEKAQADFETCLSLNDKSSPAYYGLASIAWANDDPELHKDYLEQSLAVSNNGVGERLDMALYLLGEDELDRAWEIANEVLADDPSSAGAYVIRAIVHQFEGNNRLALAEADKALAINPQYVLAHFVRAETLLANEQYEELLETAEQILEYEPEAYQVHRLLFFAAYDLEDYDEAERQYELWLDVKPEHVDDYGVQGDMELALGRYEAAVATYSTGISEGKTAEQLLYWRAIAYLNLEDEAHYKADFEQFLNQATTIDLINEAEYWLAVDKGLLVAVDGLATYTDEALGFQISYPAEWERPLLTAEDDYDFLIFHETANGFVVLNVVAVRGVSGLTLDDIVAIVSENVAESEGFTILQTQFGEIDTLRVYVLDYELVLEDGLGNDEIYLGRQYYALNSGILWIFTAEATNSEFEPNLSIIEEIMATVHFLR